MCQIQREPYCWTEHRKILTERETAIPALKLFGIYTSNRAGQPLRPHIHRDCIEIVFLLKGFQVYEVDNARFNLSGSNIFVTYPNELHGSGNYPESICDLIWLQIDLREEIPFFGLDRESAAYLRQALTTLPRFFEGDTDLSSSLTTAFYGLASEDPLQKHLGRQQLICALLRMKQLSLHVLPYHVDSIDNAIAYIHDNLNSQILLEDAAACCGLSLSRFKVRFKEKIGTTPRDYINRIKIEQAKNLLRQGRSVTDTALDLGYTTSNYFAVLFRKYTGQTPSDYRLAHTAEHPEKNR